MPQYKDNGLKFVNIYAYILRIKLYIQISQFNYSNRTLRLYEENTHHHFRLQEYDRALGRYRCVNSVFQNYDVSSQNRAADLVPTSKDSDPQNHISSAQVNSNLVIKHRVVALTQTTLVNVIITERKNY